MSIHVRKLNVEESDDKRRTKTGSKKKTAERTESKGTKKDPVKKTTEPKK